MIIKPGITLVRLVTNQMGLNILRDGSHHTSSYALLGPVTQGRVQYSSESVSFKGRDSNGIP